MFFKVLDIAETTIRLARSEAKHHSTHYQAYYSKTCQQGRYSCEPSRFEEFCKAVAGAEPNTVRTKFAKFDPGAQSFQIERSESSKAIITISRVGRAFFSQKSTQFGMMFTTLPPRLSGKLVGIDSGGMEPSNGSAAASHLPNLQPATKGECQPGNTTTIEFM